MQTSDSSQISLFPAALLICFSVMAFTFLGTLTFHEWQDSVNLISQLKQELYILASKYMLI